MIDESPSSAIRTPLPKLPRGGAAAFIFVTILLDMLALGLIMPILPKLVESFVANDTADAARIFGLSHARIIRHVILPTAMPSILVGIRYAAGVSLLALVVSEQINARAGIGYILANANLNQRSDIIMRKVESSLLPWKPQHAVA